MPNAPTSQRQPDTRSRASRRGKCSAAVAQLVVDARLLAHAVDVDLEGLRDAGREAHDRCLAHGRDYPPPVAERDRLPRAARPARARRLKVRVDPQRGVEVLLPAGAPLRAAAAAVAELRAVDRAPARRARARCARGCARAGTLPYLDERLALVPQAGRARAHRRGDDAARAGRRRRARGDRALVPARGARRDRAPPRRRERGERHAATRGLTIRNQRTRWASCASGGAMSFNWRLLLAPERVLDYVVWHEVCHLRDRRSLAALLGAARVRAAPAGASRRAGCARTAPAWCCEITRAARCGSAPRLLYRRRLMFRRICSASSPLPLLAIGAAPLASALTARRRRAARARRRAICVVTFSGTGGGSYRFHEPAAGGAGAPAASPTRPTPRPTATAGATGSSLPPGGGTSDAPVDAGRQRAAQRDRAAGAVRRRGRVTSTCTQALRTPLDRQRRPTSPIPASPSARPGGSSRSAPSASCSAATPPDCTGVGVARPQPRRRATPAAGERQLPARAAGIRDGDVARPLHDGRLRPLRRRRAERRLQLGDLRRPTTAARAAAPAAGRRAAAASARATAARSRSASSGSRARVAARRRRGLAATAARRPCGARGR